MKDDFGIAILVIGTIGFWIYWAANSGVIKMKEMLYLAAFWLASCALLLLLENMTRITQ